MKKKEIILIIVLFLLDQVTKFGLEKVLAGGSLVIITDFFSLTWVHNTGAAWSLFANSRFFLIFIGFLALGLITWFKKGMPSHVIIYSLLYAGILGNLFDRLFFGYVKDYLHFTFFNYDFPIFNLADVFIVIGALFLIVEMIKEDIHGKTRSSNRTKRTN